MKITSRQLAIAAFCLTFVLSLELIWQGFEFVTFLLDPSHQSSVFHAGSVQQGLQYTGIIAIYIYWLLKSEPENSKPQNSPEPEADETQSFLALVKPVWVFFILAFVGFPVTTDIYSYLHFGWMSWMGVNPYLTPASEFVSPMSPFLIWGQSSTYGPISKILFMVGAAFTPITVILGVYVLKAVFLLLHLTNGYLIWRHLKPLDHYKKITIAYLLNPLLLYEFIAEGHIDVLVSTFCIAFIILLRHKRYAAVLLAIVAGFFSKTLPIVWLPMACVFLIRQKRWKALAIAIFITATLCTVFSLTIFPSAKAWLSIVNPGVAYQTAGSFHNILDISVNALYNLTPIAFLRPVRIVLGFKLMTYLGFIIYYAWRCLQIYRQRSYDREDLIVEIGWATLFLFLFATPWYQPWYASILLTITALNVKSRLLISASLLYALCSTCSYHLLAFKSDNILLLLIVSCITVIPTTLLLIWRSPKPISILKPCHRP
jgi:alpha-1,6-mannosyltransferase